MTTPELTPEQRMAVDALKNDASVFMVYPQRSGKSFLASVAVAEMAAEYGGVTVKDARTGKDYHVPAGTPWQESLPVREPEAT
jgi:hypothetical protein